MNKLNQTDKGIYYIHDYIPQYKWDRMSFEETEISQRLLRYKDEGNEYALNFFTDELKIAISLFSKKVLDDNINQIALFAVPPSKVDKYSPMRISINNIANDKKYKSSLKNIIIKDYGEVLIRTKDVNTSHINDDRRAYRHEHILSIDSTVDFEDYPKDIAYLILDDITTTGTQMEVCRDVLIDNYTPEDNIYMMAIGATIR